MRGKNVMKVRDINTAVVAADSFLKHALEFVKQIGPDYQEAEGHVIKDIGGLISSATNLSLSVEFYLKALRMCLGMAVPKSHDLWSLYKNMPIEVKSALEDEYKRKREQAMNCTAAVRISVSVDGMSEDQKRLHKDRKKSRYNKSMKGVLIECNDAFQSWRYMYESGKSGELVTFNYPFLYLKYVAEVLRTYIIELIRMRKK